MKNHLKISLWLKPLIFFQAYLTIILLLFFYGPWPWPIDDSSFIYTYLILAQIFIFLGYLASRNRVIKIINYSKKLDKISVDFVHKKNLKYFKYALIVSAIFAIPTCFSRTGYLFPIYFSQLEDTGNLYLSSIQNRTPFFEYLRIIFCLPLFSLLPLTVLCWKKIENKYKFFSLFLIFFYLLIYINMGTNKGLFDLLILVPWLTYLVYVRSGKTRILTYLWKNKILVVFMVIFLFFVGSFFTSSQINRSGMVGIDSVMMIDGSPLYAEKNNSDFTQSMSDEVFIGYASITRYLTHGYYALSMARDVDYSFTFLVGNSIFLSQNIDNLLGYDYFTKNSYPGQLQQQKDYSYNQLWHSLYSWLISDFSLYGTLLIIFLLSYLLSVTWISSIYLNNYLNIVKFSVLLIIFFYIPANNQIAQSPESFVLFYWLFFFKRVNEK